ncbi:YqcI/YcgG family protein [Bacillus horti]|uniref:FPC/CPF motif-containing protein YcgG n=1 Tax=Caldalkalibacillus horti TaxID=77523 RepID=A0ABT9VY06_9BACI|nr:YqcI/YcgG family protein [Bacillus horti]MDQ0165880.1 FPC/CPF motif-containing protein YcgG [Bacillus horti]
MAELYTKLSLDEHVDSLPLWAQEAYNQFSNMMLDPINAFPCIPGRQGFQSNQLRFGFVPEPSSTEAIKQTAELLKQYGHCSKETGKYASFVLFFEPNPLVGNLSVQEYEQLFWSFLSQLSAQDETLWPARISIDPAHPSWEFCFDGQPYFTFCATPAHQKRKSRSFATFLLAFQPRWVFEEINDATPFGRNMKKLIRKNLESYDQVPVHPSLKWYGQKDNLEWQQYFLPDDQSTPTVCPFSTVWSTKVAHHTNEDTQAEANRNFE